MLDQLLRKYSRLCLQCFGHSGHWRNELIDGVELHAEAHGPLDVPCLSPFVPIDNPVEREESHLPGYAVRDIDRCHTHYGSSMPGIQMELVPYGVLCRQGKLRFIVPFERCETIVLAEE